MFEFTLHLTDEEATQLYCVLSRYLKDNADKFTPVKSTSKLKTFKFDDFNMLERKLEELGKSLEEKGLLPHAEYDH